jgi:hypothetical protein
MISHDRFGALRLAHFLPDAQIAELRDWEFMEHLWSGEAIGFSEWLRLENEPDVLRSLAYEVSCTVLNEGGLGYLVVMVPLGERAA